MKQISHSNTLVDSTWISLRSILSWDSLLPRAVLLALVLGGIWIPVILHNVVRPTILTSEQLTKLRHAPDSSTLAELGGYGYGLRRDLSPTNAVRLADKALRGLWESPGRPLRRIGVPFTPDDTTQGASDWQLHYSAFMVPRLYLVAFEASGQDRFLMAARDFILAWADFERGLWLPKGLVWNDHAVAARAVVLARFWHHYRNHQSYDEADAGVVLGLVAMCAKRLARSSQYTFATNHGVMQNLALLHLAVAFPALPEARAGAEIAISRLERQLAFYINSEGVVLEHSPGYHRYGVELLGFALRYLTLLGRPLPSTWKEKYAKALNVYAQFRRPDGSLPTFGDTATVQEPRGPLVTRTIGPDRYGPLHYRRDWRPLTSNGLYPAAGYAVLWQALKAWPASPPASQTALSWSYYPGHGHKHADDLSLHLWARGRSWWRDAGYWPYIRADRTAGIGWNGSNAPHGLSEAPDVPRQSTLIGHGSDERLSLTDVKRKGPGNLAIRRQVIVLPPDTWLILDSFTGNESTPIRTVWTANPKLVSSNGTSNVDYVLRPRDHATERLHVSFAGDRVPAVRAITGSKKPLVGWVEYDDKLVPAPAFLVDIPPAARWALNASQFTPNIPPQPQMIFWNGPEDWELVLDRGAADHQRYLRRHGDHLSLRSSDIVDLTIADPPPDVLRSIQSTKAAFARAAAVDGHKFRNLIPYRKRATYVLILLFMLQELFLYVYRRGWAHHSRALARTSLVTWTLLGIWLLAVYFT